MASDDSEAAILREFLDEELFLYYFGDATSSTNHGEFREASEVDLQRLIANTKNINTKRTTQMWMNRLSLIHGESQETSLLSYMSYPQRSWIRFYSVFC